ncbi:MAG: transglutaminase domain-containing protein [Phycisphaerales bacterium]|nr:transglutaminase domain-containing protein [Phycisphaerales bacterium]
MSREPLAAARRRSSPILAVGLFTALATLCGVSAPIGAQGAKPTSPVAEPPAPPPQLPTDGPAGRPPRGALSRNEPRIWDVSFTCWLLAYSATKGENKPLRLAENALLLPVAILDTFGQVDQSSIRTRVALNGQELGVVPHELKQVPGGMSNIEVDTHGHTGQHMSCQFFWRAQSWNSALDEVLASRTPWPREWPADATPWLAPQPYIESDDPIFAQFVKEQAGDQLHSVGVHIAAKELVKAALKQPRSVRSSGLVRSSGGKICGLELQGAKGMALTGQGSSHDLACLCVAVLRAAGIPSRVTVGAFDRPDGDSVLVSWCEYYLPDSGWVPFLPDDLRGKASSLDSSRAWSNFGTLKELNMVVPIAHGYLPSGIAAPPVKLPALWGWRSAGEIVNGALEEYIAITVTSRGRGQP